jgi:hypothetical protein
MIFKPLFTSLSHHHNVWKSLGWGDGGGGLIFDQKSAFLNRDLCSFARSHPLRFPPWICPRGREITPSPRHIVASCQIENLSTTGSVVLSINHRASWSGVLSANHKIILYRNSCRQLTTELPDQGSCLQTTKLYYISINHRTSWSGVLSANHNIILYQYSCRQLTT